MTLKQEEQEFFFYQGCSYYPLSVVLNEMLGEYGYYIYQIKTLTRELSQDTWLNDKQLQKIYHKKIDTYSFTMKWVQWTEWTASVFQKNK